MYEARCRDGPYVDHHCCDRVGCDGVAFLEHAHAIRGIVGPNCVALFDASLPVIRSVTETGLAIGVISDWQMGLAHFCDELGIGVYLDAVVASADLGYHKPDRRLFDVARERMGVAPHEILHVGDQLEDVEGVRAAGFSAALLVRDGEPPATDAPVIANLPELLSLG